MKNKFLIFATLAFINNLNGNSDRELTRLQRQLQIELAIYKHRAKIGRPSNTQVAKITQIQAQLQKLTNQRYLDRLESLKRGSF